MIRALTFALCCSALSAQVPMPNPQQTPGKGTPNNETWVTLPHKSTPGSINPKLTKAVICSPTFRTEKYRHVTLATKKQVCKSYGILKGCPGPGYEIDHLDSLWIGGSNDILNLWPQPADKPGLLGYHTKDAVEDKAHWAVCSGKISLQDAQRGMAHDWYTFGLSLQ